AIGAPRPTRPFGEGGRTTPLPHADGQAAQREEMEPPHDAKRIQMQRRAVLGQRPLVCWRGNRCRVIIRDGDHGLTSYAGGPISRRSQPSTPFPRLGNALMDLIHESGDTAFPPRLPFQPIFYPVLTEDY